MGRNARKKHPKYAQFGKGAKTKRRTRDLDQIDGDIQPEKIDKLLNQPVDYDLPGDAQFYCVHCAKHFMDNNALEAHFRGKPHKKRLRDLEEEPYTQDAAEAAAGKGSYVPPKKRRIETQPSKEPQSMELSGDVNSVLAT